MAVVNQVVFKAARRIAEIRVILDALPGWKFSSFAHEHLVETVALHGEICRSSRGTVCGFIDGAMVSIAIQDAGTTQCSYERVQSTGHETRLATRTREVFLLALALARPCGPGCPDASISTCP